MAVIWDTCALEHRQISPNLSIPWDCVTIHADGFNWNSGLRMAITIRNQETREQLSPSTKWERILVPLLYLKNPTTLILVSHHADKALTPLFFHHNTLIHPSLSSTIHLVSCSSIGNSEKKDLTSSSDEMIIDGRVDLPSSSQQAPTSDVTSIPQSGSGNSPAQNIPLAPNSAVFHCRSFHDDFLILHDNFHTDSFDPDEYKIVEFALGSKDGSQMYSMTTQCGSLPVLKVTGEISVCHMVPQSVHRARVTDRPLRMDKYILRLALSSKVYQMCVINATKTTTLRQSQKEKLFDICRAAKHHSKKEQFDKEGIDIVFHGLMNANEFVFTKNVATLRALDKEHPLYALMPTQAERTFMRKPSTFEWNNKVPIFDESYNIIDLVETNVTDKQADVYFQVNQLFYGSKLRLNPEICAVKVIMSEVLESPKKKARRSALF